LLFKRAGSAVKHLAVLAAALALPARRAVLGQMVAFSRALPTRFDHPLLEMMAALTPTTTDLPLPATEIRRLTDAVAAWHLVSPVGICLRRSLLRYYFLRRAGLPVVIVFGARIKPTTEGGGIGGHAWLTLHGQPYFESSRNYQGFAVMVVFPKEP
jgi:hypothetical protein